MIGRIANAPTCRRSSCLAPSHLQAPAAKNPRCGKDLQLSTRMRSLLEDMQAEWRQLDCRIEQFDNEFAALDKTDDAARCLATIPGIGVLNAKKWRSDAVVFL